MPYLFLAEYFKLKNIPKGEKIAEPDRIFLVVKLSDQTAKFLGVNREVVISRRSLKHIIEQRGKLAKKILESIPNILSHPTKIVDNSQKRPNSYLFVKINGKAKGVVLETTKKPDINRVVSAYFINKKTYAKLVDISGRPDVPPSTPFITGGAESEISAFQKSTDISVAK